MAKRFEYDSTGTRKILTSYHNIHLQVELSGGFWDTIQTATDKKFNENSEVFDEQISNKLKAGFKVRLLTVFVEQTEMITGIVKEL